MLTEQSGEKYRLPTEAEWEYACRAGTNTLYSFGDLLPKTQANYGSYSTVEVGLFPPNNFGLYDMPGNVWEWCQDHWHDNYLEAPTDGRAWLDNDENDSRILRGGSWYCDRRCCRSAFRTGSEPDDQDNEYGFRVVCEIAK
jgi:formylglycine-generating enzyme required for sulfatase activity